MAYYQYEFKAPVLYWGLRLLVGLAFAFHFALSFAFALLSLSLTRTHGRRHGSVPRGPIGTGRDGH